MDAIEIKVSNATIEKMKKYYDSQMIASDDSVLFKAQAIGSTIEVTLDNVAIISGENQIREAAHWSKKYEILLNETKVDTSAFCNQEHIGTSECGSQDYLGPICFVSCYVSKEDIEFLKELNIEDPSKLTTQEVINYAKQLKDRIKYGLLILDNSHYNKMVEEGLNLPAIRAKLSNQSTVNMMQKVKKNIAVKAINQFVSPKTYFNYLKNDVAVVKDLTFDENASQKYMAVLAADILAQYAYLQYFANMTRSLKIKLPRGTGHEVDVVVAKVVQKYGEKILLKTTKTNFTDTKKVKSILEKAKK